MAKNNKNEKMAKQFGKDFSDKQAVEEELSTAFDHEFANEPLSDAEKMLNKKTKKRQ